MPKVRLSGTSKSSGLSIHVLTTDEHPPPHVHVFKGPRPVGPNCRVKLGGPGDIGDPTLDPVLWGVSGSEFSLREAWNAVELVRQNLEACWKIWRQYHD